jgi:glyoxylase-like metal-dependent hydrolase (beta-lactamase superfamily II)
MQWKIGDVTVTKIVELEVAGKATWIVPELTPENLATVAWCRPHFATEDGRVVMSVHALVVESRGRRILVDTCVGNDKTLNIPNWNNRQGPFLTDLAAAGFPAAAIDTVLCTHLHVDHVGWNTSLENGRWVPTFRHARYLWHRTEYEHWSRTEQDVYGPVVQQSVLPVFEAGLVDLVDATHAVTDEVRLEPTHGHTPGHVSVRISSRGEEAVITGDLMHHPAQCAHPEWHSSADSDPQQAERTRRDFLARHADRPTLVIGTHFAGPTAGRIVRDGDTYRFAV